jgi:hypothetical protein
LGTHLLIKKVALKTLSGRKRTCGRKNRQKIVPFLEPKIGKLQCTHLKCTILKLFAPNPLANPIACFFIYLQLASMIPWILAATVRVIFYLFFIIIIFYSVQVIKLKNKPSYISNSNPMNLFVKHSDTLASFA